MTLPGELALSTDATVLTWLFEEEQVSLGWPLIGGGRSVVDRVEWHFATSDDLTLDVDAAQWLLRRLAHPDRTAAFLTSRRLDSFDHASIPLADGTVEAVATVGLGNALRVGDPLPAAGAPVGTINLAIRVPVALTEEAHLEALAIGQEAKCAAMLGSGVGSVVSSRAATGTGTDCAVVLAPAGTDQSPVAFAGKHTALGSAIGQAADKAISLGIDKWIRETNLATNPKPQ